MSTRSGEVFTNSPLKVIGFQFYRLQGWMPSSRPLDVPSAELTVQE